MAKEEIHDLSVKLSLNSEQYKEGMASVSRGLEIARAEFRLASTQLGEFGGSSEQLGLKADYLGKQLELQKQRVEILSKAYEESKVKSGENTQATEKLYVQLLNAQRYEANLENQIKATNNQMTNQTSIAGMLNSVLQEQSLNMQLIKAKYDLAGASLGNLGNKEEEARLKSEMLKSQLREQFEVVNTLKSALDGLIKTKGNDAKETQEMRLKLLQAQKAEIDLNNELKNVNQSLDEQGKKLQETGGKAGGFSNMLKNAFSVTMGMGFFDAIKQGFNYAKEAAFGFNSSLQQNQIAFTTMLGSAEKANEYIQGMMEFSSRTPFEFTDLAEGSKLLMAFGFEAEKLPGMLKAIGDASAGLGMSGSEGLQRIGLQLGQMNTLGKATYQDLKQLAQAGVPVWDILAEAIGKSTGQVQEMVSKGLLPASETIDVLIAGMQEKFPNMMEEQSKSWQGLTSSIKDNISIALGTLTQGLFQDASGMLEHISISLQNFNEIAKDQGMRAALETLIPKVLVDSLAVMKNSFEWIIEHGTVVKATIIGIGTAFAAIKLAKLLSDTERLTKVWTNVSSVFQKVNVKTLLIGGAIALLAGTAYVLYRNWENVAPFFSSMWDVIENSFKTAGNAIMVVLRGLQVGLAEFLNFTLGNLTKMVSGMLDLFSHIPGIGEAFEKAKSGVDKFGKGIDDFVDSSKKALNEAIANTKDSANEVAKSWNNMTEAGSKMVSAVGEDLSGLVQKTKDSFKSMSDTSNFDTATMSMEEAGANLVDAVGKGAEKKKKATKQKLEKIASEMNTAIILIDAEIKRLLADDSSFEVQQANIQRAMELTADKIKILENEFFRLSKVKNVNKDALNQLTKEIENAKLAYDELGKKLIDVAEKIKQANIKTANDFVEQIKGALKRRYDEEKELRESSLNEELKSLDSWKDESIKRINDVYDHKIKLIEESSNSQIEALNAELQALDNYEKEKTRAEQDKEDFDKINRLKDAIEYEHNEFNKAQLQKELANAEKDLSKRKDKEKLEDKKQAIRDEITNLKEKARLEKEILQQQQNEELARINDLYTASKNSLQTQLNDLKEYYKIRLQDAQLQAEAEQMIMTNNQEAIMDLLYQYTDHYKAVGQTFGDMMVEGFAPMIDEIHKMIDEVMERINAARKMQLSYPRVNTSLVGGNYTSQGNTPVQNSKNSSGSKQLIFNTTVNSLIARTPSQERKEVERSQRNMIFQAGLA